MRKFIIQISCFSLLVVTTEALLLFLPLPGSGFGNLSGMTDKRVLLKKSTSPKIVFVGDSNTVFGIDSPALEEKLGKPVINMGIHGNLGLRYILNEVKPYVQQGDVYLIVPQYQHFFGNFLEGDETLLEYLKIFPDAINEITTLRQRITLITKIPKFNSDQVRDLIRARVFHDSRIPYFDSFNEHGDLEFYLKKDSIDISEKPLFLKREDRTNFNPMSIAILNDFNRYVQAKGATAVFLFPPVSYKHYRENRDIIDPVYHYVKNDAEMPVADNPEAFTFPLDHFFDTVYHLNSKGMEKRTEYTFNLLKRLL